jgi:hypothetical protein
MAYLNLISKFHGIVTNTVPTLPMDIKHVGGLSFLGNKQIFKFAIITTAAYAAHYFIKRYIDNHTSPVGNVYSSYIISYLSNRTPQLRLKPATIRKSFLTSADIYYPQLPESNNHSHPIACVMRNASVIQITQIATELGLSPYVVQMSNSDVKNELSGCRTYHWAKDIAVAPSDFSPEENDVVVIIDSDMYLDMPNMLARYPRVYMLSTFQPTAVAAQESNYDFTFDENNIVHYSVSGGATYVHQVWNYNKDDIMVTTPGDTFGFGLWWKTTIYNIERRQYQDHHQILLLTPLRTINSPIFSLTYWLKSNNLTRLEVVVPGTKFMRMDVITQSGRMRSTGIVNTYQCATIRVTDDDTLASQARLGTTALTPHQVKTFIQHTDVGVCSILTEFHRLKIKYDPQCVTPVSETINRYQFDPKNFDPDAKALMVPFMSNIISGCYVPDRSVNNEKRAVDGRVKEIKNKPIEITSQMTRYINEFSELLFPEAGILHPMDQDTVFAKQHRPTQRNILNKATLRTDLVDEDRPIESFLKAEPYGDVKDPRIISTIPGVTKLSYSMYAYSYAEHLRTQPWYAFGKTPLVIANRVADICRNAQSVYNTDFARFDGRVSNVLRALERVIMMRGFNKVYHTDLAELMLSQYGQRAVTKYGIKYFTDFTRASGSPETADMNSTDNAFVAYIALRSCRINGEFMSPKQAFEALGIYGGDDGLTSDIDEDTYKSAASSVGQSLDIQEVSRGNLGVTFLSRYYSPFVWEGALDSMCDLRRQLSKLHVTVSLPSNVSALEKLAEKLRGYAVMDSNTPIIGELISKFRTFYPNIYGTGIRDQEAKRLVANFYSNFEINEQYPNENYCSWMESLQNIWFPDFDHDLLNSFYRAVERGDTNIIQMPQCEPSTSLHFGKRPVVINGELRPSCRYGIFCRATKCDYEHTCPFGASCKNRNCELFHNDLPYIVEESGTTIKEVDIPIIDNSVTQKVYTKVGSADLKIDPSWCKFDDAYCRKLKIGQCTKQHRAHKTAITNKPTVIIDKGDKKKQYNKKSSPTSNTTPINGDTKPKKQ